MSRIVIALISSFAALGFATTASASTLTTGLGVRLSASDVIVPVGFKCGMVDGKLVCGSTKGNKDRDENDDDDDDKPSQSKDKVIPKTCGKKVNCEAGFVKLEKPNKYGACCEAREGLPPAKQQEAEKCKFPGEVGTPPNCKCPEGTDFQGYKGCVKLNAGRICQNFDRSVESYTKSNSDRVNFKNECVSKYKSKKGATCVTNEGPGNFDRCCCDYTY